MRQTLVIAVFILLSSFTFAQHLGPRVAVNKLEYIVGTQSNAEIDTVNFIISNAGDERLKIESTKTSCKCLTYSLQKNDLAPGEGAKLDVYYKYNGKSKEGNEEYVYVKTNDPVNPVLRLIVKSK